MSDAYYGTQPSGHGPARSTRDNGRDPTSDQHHQDRRDEYSRPPQDSTRSPPRQESHRNSAWKQQRDSMRDSNHEERPRQYGRYAHGDGVRGRNYREQEFGQDDYASMYDDVPRDKGRSQHYDDDRSASRGRLGYRDYGGPRHRSRSGDRSRSRSRSPGRGDAGRPSDTVILEGLPQSISQSELRESLLKSSIASEGPSFDVRIPSSSKGHRRAFIQFENVDRAIDFVQEHYPKLRITLRHATDETPDGEFDAYLHYARPRDDADPRAQNTSWTCPQCEASNYSSRTFCRSCGSYPSGAHWQQSLTGAADAADVPSQLLVVFPLPPFVDEEMLAREMKRLELEKPSTVKAGGDVPKLKSTAPTSTGQGYGASQGSLHRIFLMRDSQTKESFKYGFAEFWTLEDAAAAMKKFTMARSFTLAGCAVTISTIHMGVFLPEDREMSHMTESQSFNPLFNPSIRVRYRDERVYPSQLLVTAEPPGGAQVMPTTEEQDEAKRSKKRKADGNMGNSTKRPPAMAGKMAMWQRKHDELHGGEARAESSPEAGDRQKSQAPKLSAANATIKISLSSVSKLTGQPEAHAEPEISKAKSASPGKEDATPVSFVDRDRLMCLICMRKYKSVDEVNIHERSRNHKTATEDADLVKAALPRLAVRDKRLEKSQGKSEAAPDPNNNGDNPSATADGQYRDRAKERRQVYSQPKKPTPQREPLQDKTTASAPAAAAAAAPSASKGASLLVKMGWTAGSGLGANGEGRTAVIETNAYQEGVGLGAEGSNLGDASERAGRQTRGGYAEYVSSVQDKARQRYNRLESEDGRGN